MALQDEGDIWTHRKHLVMIRAETGVMQLCAKGRQELTAWSQATKRQGRFHPD